MLWETDSGYYSVDTYSYTNYLGYQYRRLRGINASACADGTDITEERESTLIGRTESIDRFSRTKGSLDLCLDILNTSMQANFKSTGGNSVRLIEFLTAP